ncbi:MAG: glycosyltransferase [Porphyromonadaceae bacterium]|nr:glycosyltransferase [Porphyromonadaceae bacterium]
MNLSIVIPTYNREQQLRNQLTILCKQDLTYVKEIIIIDNCSDYEIDEVINEFESDKIRLIRNTINTKMAYNLAAIFLHCNTEWLWSLSDDDEVEEDAIDKIKKEIENVSTDVGMIKFARTNSPQKEFTTNNLESFIDYYYNEKVIRSGDLIFISTNVYNIYRLNKYLGYAFEYAYTYVPQIIPIIKGLEENKVSIKFSNKSIVKYLPPIEGNYSYATVGKGLSTFSHLPLETNKKYQRRFLQLIMSIKFTSMIRWSIKYNSINELGIIYNNIYRYYLPIYKKFVVKFFLLTMSSKLSRTIAFELFKILRRIK